MERDFYPLIILFPLKLFIKHDPQISPTFQFIMP